MLATCTNLQTWAFCSFHRLLPRTVVFLIGVAIPTGNGCSQTEDTAHRLAAAQRDSAAAADRLRLAREKYYSVVERRRWADDRLKNASVDDACLEAVILHGSESLPPAQRLLADAEKDMEQFTARHPDLYEEAKRYVYANTTAPNYGKGAVAAAIADNVRVLKTLQRKKMETVRRCSEEVEKISGRLRWAEARRVTLREEVEHAKAELLSLPNELTATKADVDTLTAAVAVAAKRLDAAVIAHQQRVSKQRKVASAAETGTYAVAGTVIGVTLLFCVIVALMISDYPRRRSPNLNEATAKPGAPAAPDHHGVLGVPPGASHEQILDAFREKVKHSHPDVNPGDKQAADRFKKIVDARDTLTSNVPPPPCEEASRTDPEVPPAPKPKPSDIFGFRPIDDADAGSPPPARLSGGDRWWIGVVIGALSAMGTAVSGGGGSVAGATVAVVLNPLVWLGVFSIFKIRRTFVCPHCRHSHGITETFRNAPLGSVGLCPRCRNAFRKS